MLTDRGRLVLALAAGIYLVAWGFGSRSLYPVAIGLALAALGAKLWVMASRQPVTLRRSLGRQEHVEGNDVTVGLEANVQRYPGPRSLEVVERAGRLGERRVRLARHGRTLLARYVLASVPRGRYRFEAVRAIFEDPFGLARAESQLGAESALLVYPRLVELDRVFTQAAGLSQAGGGCCFAARPGSTCTACGSISRASLCTKCTGGRLRSAESSWSRSSRTLPTTR